VTTTRGRKRNRRPTKKFDVNGLRRSLMQGQGSWVKLAIVTDIDDDGRHFELVIENGVLVDIMVEVETVPDCMPLTCRMSGLGGGTWTVPAVGDEVIVALPDARAEFMSTIVAVLSGNNIPNPVGQGPAANRTIITNSEVLVHDGTGGAVALALKSDVQTVRNELHEHTHTYALPLHTAATANTGTGPSVTSPAGTTILKAK